MRMRVKSIEVSEKHGTSKRTGQPYTIREQFCFWENAATGEVRRVTLSLREGQEPYAVGQYNVSDESFGVDRFGGLAVERLRLEPVAQAARAVG